MRIAVCSADPLLRDGIVAILETNSDIEVVSSAGNIRDCLTHVQVDAGTVVILDLAGQSERDLDFLVGAQAIGRFRTILIGQDEKLVGDLPSQVERNVTGSELVHVIQGLETPSHGAPVQISDQPHSEAGPLPLSAREHQAALMIADGFSNARIAEVMNIKLQSVNNLVSTITRKLGCDNRVQVALRLTNSR